MHSETEFNRIIETARIHYANLKADIANASTRIEHIRISALAQEAHKLLTELEVFEIGLVYTRVQHMTDDDLRKYVTLNEEKKAAAVASAQDFQEPEFKSPFTPPTGM